MEPVYNTTQASHEYKIQRLQTEVIRMQDDLFQLHYALRGGSPRLFALLGYQAPLGKVNSESSCEYVVQCKVHLFSSKTQRIKLL